MMMRNNFRVFEDLKTQTLHKNEQGRVYQIKQEHEI